MTITLEPQKAIINGTALYAEIGTVEEAWLGREDHGIYTYVLTLKFPGAGQGAGSYNLNNPESMGKHLIALMDFFGCPFNYIKGRKVYALRADQRGSILGLLSEDQRKTIIFSEVVDG